MYIKQQVRDYEAYKALEERIKAMQGSLPLISELSNPAMRDRHWTALMTAIKTSFVMDDSFTLGGMLLLELHRYPDVCAEVVDCAQKELVVEKVI